MRRHCTTKALVFLFLLFLFLVVIIIIRVAPVLVMVVKRMVDATHVHILRCCTYTAKFPQYDKSFMRILFEYAASKFGRIETPRVSSFTIR